MGNQSISNTEKVFEAFSEKDRLYGFINVVFFNLDQ
jgi:hypothetical protein